MPTRAQLVDLARRAAWTAAQAFLAVFVIADVATVRAALVAAAAAVLSACKTFVAQRIVEIPPAA